MIVEIAILALIIGLVFFLNYMIEISKEISQIENRINAVSERNSQIRDMIMQRLENEINKIKEKK